MGKLIKIAVLGAVFGGLTAPAYAQSSSMSDTIVLQSVESDDRMYRRMVVINYQNGVSYKAYTRREFKRFDAPDSKQLVAQCVNGAATSLREIKAFNKAERKRERSGQAPQPATFCIKNVPDWANKNKDIYLNPIFEGMPYVSKRIR